MWACNSLVQVNQDASFAPSSLLCRSAYCCRMPTNPSWNSMGRARNESPYSRVGTHVVDAAAANVARCPDSTRMANSVESSFAVVLPVALGRPPTAARVSTLSLRTIPYFHYACARRTNPSCAIRVASVILRKISRFVAQFVGPLCFSFIRRRLIAHGSSGRVP